MVGFGANAASAGNEGKLSSVGTEILLENSLAGQCQCAGDCRLVQQFRDWACHVHGVPAGERRDGSGAERPTAPPEDPSSIPGPAPHVVP